MKTDKGRSMVLRKLKQEDAVGMLEWMQDEQIRRNFRFTTDKKRLTQTEVLEFIDTADYVFRDKNSIHYAVTQAGGEYLGTVSLKNIDLTAKNAEYAIVLRKKAQGKGLAWEATKEILRLAFLEFGLERVYLNVLKENKRAVRLYEKCGFVYEGEFRRHLFLRGEYKMLRWYGILKEEYQRFGGGIRQFVIDLAVWQMDTASLKERQRNEMGAGTAGEFYKDGF